MKSDKSEMIKNVFYILIALALVGLVIFQVHSFRCNNKYAEAAELMEDGSYEEALEIFQSLHSFKDSEDMAAQCSETIETINAENEAGYSQAVQYEEEGKYYNAYLGFLSLGEYSDSSERANADLELAKETLQPGDSVIMGTYYYSEQPIEWTVLAVEDQDMLLISNQVYFPLNISVSDFGEWAACSARSTLNDGNDFSFSDSENPFLNTVQTTSETNDRVFVLSAEEAEYFLNVGVSIDGKISESDADNSWITRSMQGGNLVVAGDSFTKQIPNKTPGIRPVISVSLTGTAHNVSVADYSVDSDPDLNWSLPSEYRECPQCAGEGYMLDESYEKSDQEENPLYVSPQFDYILVSELLCCPLCAGNGYISEDTYPNTEEVCSLCSGSGQVQKMAYNECEVCGGSGYTYQTCSNCGGKGYTIETHNYADNNKKDKVTCFRCNGTGSVSTECNNCGGIGRRIGTDYFTCSACFGTGKIYSISAGDQ